MDSKQSSLLLQKNIKNNTEELHDFLADLKCWEKEIKEVDQKLSSQCNSKGKKNSGEDPTTPPVRSKNLQDTAKTTLKPTQNKPMVIANNNNNSKKVKRLPCDYAAWDKFDVDKALDSEEDEEVEHKQSSSKSTSSSRTPAPSKKERANTLKEEGNKLYSSGRLEDAVAKYTQGMALDPTNALLPANRAMAYIKLKKYTAAEADCNRCLKLDCCYIKGYLRRATARLNLGKEELARRDYLKVLEMEPINKEAKRELEKLRGTSSSQEEHKNTQQLPDNDRLGKEQERVTIPLQVVKEGAAAMGRENEPRDPSLATAHKREGSGKKVKIIEVDSSRTDGAAAKANQILPIEKAPHLRSKKPLKRIPVKDVACREDTNKKPVVEMSVADCTDGGGRRRHKTRTATTWPPEPAVLVNSMEEVPSVPVVPRLPAVSSVPSVPRTTHQFIQDWERLSNKAEATADYLKMIPPAFFRTVDLDTKELVDVAAAMIGDRIPPALAAQHLLALSVSLGFSISIMFLEADQKQVILSLISKCKQVEGYGAKMEALEATIQSS